MTSVCGLPFCGKVRNNAVVVSKRSCRRIECGVLQWTCSFVATICKLLLPYQQSSVDTATLCC